MSLARNIYEMGMSKYVPENPYCVMLGVDSPLFYPDYLSLPLFQEGQYFESSGKKYMQGIAGEYHITMKYGILPTVDSEDIHEVLARWSPHNPLEPTRNHWDGDYEVFGPADADYEAVVVPITVTDFLYGVHQELNCLPNVCTFPDYRPHITIGYFQKGFWETVPRQLYPPLKSQIGTKSFVVTGGNNA